MHAHLVDCMYPPGVEQDALCQSGLPRVNVRRDTNVTDVRQLIRFVCSCLSER